MFNVEHLRGSKILWIGAHPDDELFVAPLLGAMSHEARVDFLVATRGERGPCYRPEGCEPDLATVRQQEMRNAAAVFGGSVAFADCADGSAATPEEVLSHWSPHLPKIAAAIERFVPDVILPLDPDHGSTSHADHRAIGRLVTSLDLHVPVWLAESSVKWGAEIHISSARPDAEEFDARGWWEYLIRDLECHRSQIRASTIAAFANVPDAEKRVWIHRGGHLLTSSSSTE